MGKEKEEKKLRLIVKNFLSKEECNELKFIHKSNSTVGYRPNVFSTTLFHLIPTHSSHLIIPFLPIRERLKEKVEEFFGCEYELFVEFTGLISWSRGASIGWHSDDNRPYLKQRDFAAVCYLNSYGEDFKGGLFHFQDGEPTTVTPLCGDCVMYSADSHNVHSVDEITDGERLTLTLWFSRDNSHDEDAKLVPHLSQSLLHDHLPYCYLPLPASSNMYWFSPEQDSNFKSGFDVCWARLHALGYDIYLSQDITGSDFSELLIWPLQLVRGNELFNREFANVLHALQIVQYHYWKASDLDSTDVKEDSSKVVPLSQEQNERVRYLKSLFSKDDKLAESVFSYDGKEQHWFGWANFAAAAEAWEDYASNLGSEIIRSLPYWKTNQSIFCVSFCD